MFLQCQGRMNIAHVLKRAQSLHFTGGGKCLSMNVPSPLLLIVEKMVDAVLSRGGKRGKKGH